MWTKAESERVSRHACVPGEQSPHRGTRGDPAASVALEMEARRTGQLLGGEHSGSPVQLSVGYREGDAPDVHGVRRECGECFWRLPCRATHCARLSARISAP